MARRWGRSLIGALARFPLLNVLATKLRSRLLRPPRAELAQLSHLLGQWPLAAPRIVRPLGGVAGANWLVDDGGRKLLLHRSASPAAYVGYQLDAVAFLRAAGFSLVLPEFISTTAGERFHDAAGARWTLRGWLAGDRFAVIGEPAIRAVAARAGEFARLMAGFDHKRGAGAFRLPLLGEDIGDGLERIAPLRRALTARDAAAIRALPVQTIYHDWHPWNLLGRDGALTGLIDFDSLVEAPAVADLANALGNCLLLADMPSAPVAAAFLDSYAAERPLSAAERVLARTLLIHRLLLPPRLLGLDTARREAALEWLAGQESL